MAYHFHELSPYVLIGNPLTLVVIEIFAVPGALLGAALYPLGLDAPVWHYVGLGIDFVLWAARQIAAAPGSTVHLQQFAPWAIIFLSLAVLSTVLWRTAIWRATALPFLILGLLGAMNGEKYDVAIAPGGEAFALRQADGNIALVGKRPNAFAGEQWLRAAGDGRRPGDAVTTERCDPSGCTAVLADGRAVALVLDATAFAEDCSRASVVVTPLFAPAGCAAPLVIDRRWLTEAGATTLALRGDQFDISTARAPGEDRPWSPAPKTRRPAKITRGRFLRTGPERGSEPEPARDDTVTAPWL